MIAPFASASGLLTVSANGAVRTQHFTVEHGSAVLEVPIADTDTRGLTVQVDLAGRAPRLRDDGTSDPKLPPRPAYATASLPLQVKPANETLKVSAVARDRVTAPGAHDTVDVSVAGADGSAVAGADVAVVVVDDAVLSLTDYKLADPISAMYAPQTDATSGRLSPQQLGAGEPRRVRSARHDTVEHGRGAEFQVVLARHGAQRDLAVNAAGASTGAGSGARYAPAIPQSADAFKQDGSTRTTTHGLSVRTNFDALALFSPSVRTDATGVAHVSVDLPDNLTRYRVMAVAADNAGRFGGGESTLTARLPLQIRPSPPRFANFGDSFELPVVVQNQTDKEMVVDVVAETSNLTLTDAHGIRVKVPANDRVEVRFPVKTDAAGTARYRISATHGADADSATGEFPVYTPVTTEAFATYGVVDNGAIAQPVQTPTGVVPQYGGLEIDTSSTAMQALTDAVVYLDDYPYESADAYASRIIALTSLRDVFAAFGGEGVPTPPQVDARIRSDIKALTALQNDDGGFSTWTRGGDPAALHQRSSHRSARARAARRFRGAGQLPTVARSRTYATSNRSSPRSGARRTGTRRARTRCTCATRRVIATRRRRRRCTGPTRGLRWTRSRGCGRSSTTRRSRARSRERSRIERTRRRAPRPSPRPTPTPPISCSARIDAPTGSCSTR